jgi:uncharacterized protein YjiS (DUF1127 family)
MVMTKIEQVGAGATFGPDSMAKAATLRVIAWCKACAERRRQRHFLAMLDDHALRDIGLGRVQANIESEKPFWRL